ncbi:hypothetical protein D3C79_971340 [compost metagenome]
MAQVGDVGQAQFVGELRQVLAQHATQAPGGAGDQQTFEWLAHGLPLFDSCVQASCANASRNWPRACSSSWREVAKDNRTYGSTPNAEPGTVATLPTRSR